MTSSALITFPSRRRPHSRERLCAFSPGDLLDPGFKILPGSLSLRALPLQGGELEARSGKCRLFHARTGRRGQTTPISSRSNSSPSTSSLPSSRQGLLGCSPIPSWPHRQMSTACSLGGRSLPRRAQAQGAGRLRMGAPRPSAGLPPRGATQVWACRDLSLSAITKRSRSLQKGCSGNRPWRCTTPSQRERTGGSE